MSRTAPPTTYAFTRISPAGVGLVGGYELGLAARGFAPLAHRGQLSDRVAIALRRRRQRHGVSFKARDYGRIEGVGDREAAEEQLAAGTEAAAAFGPDLVHAIDVLLRLRRHALAGMAAADVHPHRAAQRLEARMHLGADRARRACGAAGHSCFSGCRSATVSQIASESHTGSPSITSTGTLRVGE